MTTANFDRLAKGYRTLEYLAFGRMLERARTALLPMLATSTHILLVGDGDGRCLETLLRIAPRVRVTSLDASQEMLALARRRATDAGAADRVGFVCADARTWPCPRAHFDAIVTAFFLDCFTSADVDAIVTTLAPSLRPGARWLFVDFAVPPRGAPRLYARILLPALYAFFRWQTRIEARTLPPSEAILLRAGFTIDEARTFGAGLVRAVCFSCPSS